MPLFRSFPGRLSFNDPASLLSGRTTLHLQVVRGCRSRDTCLKGTTGQKSRRFAPSPFSRRRPLSMFLGTQSYWCREDVVCTETTKTGRVNAFADFNHLISEQAHLLNAASRKMSLSAMSVELVDIHPPLPSQVRFYSPWSLERWADFTRLKHRRYLHVHVSVSSGVHDWFEILVWSKVDPQETSPLLPKSAPSLASVVATPKSIAPNSRPGKTSTIAAARASILHKTGGISATGIIVHDREPLPKLTDSDSDSEAIPNQIMRKVMRRNRQVLTITSDADLESPVRHLKPGVKENKFTIKTETLCESVPAQTSGTRAWSYLLTHGSVVFPQIRRRGRKTWRTERLVRQGLLPREHLTCLVCGLHLVIGAPEFMFIVKPVLQRIMVQGLESINLRPTKLMQKIRSWRLVSRKSLRSSVLAWRTRREKTPMAH